MQRAILNKSWRQHPTKHQLYGHLPPIMKPIQVRWTRHAGPPYMAEQKLDGQLEHTYSSSVRIRDVALRTCQKQWTIGRSGERGSGIFVLTARHDDDDDNFRSCWAIFHLKVLCFLLSYFIFIFFVYISEVKTQLTKQKKKKNLIKAQELVTRWGWQGS